MWYTVYHILIFLNVGCVYGHDPWDEHYNASRSPKTRNGFYISGRFSDLCLRVAIIREMAKVHSSNVDGINKNNHRSYQIGEFKRNTYHVHLHIGETEFLCKSHICKSHICNAWPFRINIFEARKSFWQSLWGV